MLQRRNFMWKVVSKNLRENTGYIPLIFKTFWGQKNVQLQHFYRVPSEKIPSRDDFSKRRGIIRKEII